MERPSQLLRHAAHLRRDHDHGHVVLVVGSLRRRGKGDRNPQTLVRHAGGECGQLRHHDRPGAAPLPDGRGDFIGAVNYVSAVAPDKYGLPMAPMLPLLVSIIPKGVFIPLLIAITFIAWTPLVHFIQMVQPIRALFAWSFDRLLPAKVAEVDERTHAPLVAIIIVTVIGVGFFAWSVWAASFFTALVLAGLAGAGVMIIMGITAIAFPYRNRQLYESSPAKIEVLGVPLCVIAGVVTILAEVLIAYFYVTDSRLGLGDPGAAVALHRRHPGGRGDLLLHRASYPRPAGHRD